MPSLDIETQRELVPLRDVILKYFTRSDWMALGAITGCLEIIEKHPRLLRSLNFGDDDYAGHIILVLVRMIEVDFDNLTRIETYISDKFDDTGGTNISSKEILHSNKIYFTPSVFSVPDDGIQRDLVSVMMPFGLEFSDVYTSVVAASKNHGLSCKRVDRYLGKLGNNPRCFFSHLPLTYCGMRFYWKKPKCLL